MKVRSAFLAIEFLMLARVICAQTLSENGAIPRPLPDDPNVTTTGGTANYLPVFNGTSTIIDSVVYQNGTNLGINTVNPEAMPDVNGAVNATTGFNIGGSPFALGPVSSNAFLGFAGNSTMMGIGSVGVGAFASNTTGEYNTGLGADTLYCNSTGPEMLRSQVLFVVLVYPTLHLLHGG
jgi:hypothetical protein